MPSLPNQTAYDDDIDDDDDDEKFGNWKLGDNKGSLVQRQRNSST